MSSPICLPYPLRKQRLRAEIDRQGRVIQDLLRERAALRTDDQFNEVIAAVGLTDPAAKSDPEAVSHATE